MTVRKTKQRYSVSLRPEVVSRFQALVKEAGYPPSVMSATCEDALERMSEAFDLAKQKGHFALSDIFTLMGQQMSLLERGEVRRFAKPTQKNKRVAKGNEAGLPLARRGRPKKVEG